MAKSVLELAVQTGQWNSGLKKAKDTLNNFTEASGGLSKALQNDSEKIQKFVQMMGRTESTARTAKGQMNDYKATIEQLTMQYNRMTDAQKKSVGQDYLKSIEQIKQKYSEVNDEVKKMNDSLSGKGSGSFLSSVGGKMSGALQVFAGNMMTKAAGVGLGMVDEMAGMVQQGIELAKAGEGIRIAFERLGRGDILDGLRQATHGTVTDLELMKAAVKFNDFNLPLNELGTMLAFAQQKAKDTGQSVSYLVDSIVNGLGRKSKLILDNLGISATELDERMKETGDMTTAVGAIIREQMSKAGDYVETAADRAAQANVSLQNKMEELGRKFAPVEEASNQLWTSMKIAILDVVGGPLAKLLNGLTEAGRLRNQINAYNGGGNGSQTHLDRVIGMLRHYSGDKQGLYNRQVAKYNSEISWREQYAKDIRAWQRGERSTALEQRIRTGQRRMGTDVLDASEVITQANAWREISRQYQAAAKTILNPQAPSPAGTTTGTTTTTTTKGGKTVVEEKKKEATFQQIIAGLEKEAMSATGERYDTLVRLIRLYDSAIAKEKEMRSQMHGTNEERDEFQEWGPLDEWNDQLKTLRTAQSHAQTPEEYASYGEQIRTTQKSIDEFTGGNDKESGLDKLIKDIDKGNELYSKAVGGISNIVGGMQQLGVEVPEGLSNLLNALGGISTILTGISSILSFISIMTTKPAFLAMGGAIRAATGVVAGRNFSGDTVPALLNSGEVVLNRAEVSTLANTIENGNRNESVDRQPYVTGEYIFLGLNNYLRSIGKGSIVTAKQ